MRVCFVVSHLLLCLSVRVPIAISFVVTAMACSAVQVARRALVKLLLALAAACSVTVSVTQQSSDVQVGVAYWRIVKVVHPDKGGKAEDAQKLQGAKEQWDHAKRAAVAGRPRASKGQEPQPRPQPRRAVGGSWAAGLAEIVDPREARSAFRWYP
jgi:hypothetical protein